MSDNSDKGAKGDQKDAKPMKVARPSEARAASPAKPSSAAKPSSPAKPAASGKPSSPAKPTGASAAGAGAPATRSTPAAKKPAATGATPSPAKPNPAASGPAASKGAKPVASPAGTTASSSPGGQGAPGKGKESKSQQENGKSQENGKEVAARGSGKGGFGARLRGTVEKTASFTQLNQASDPDDQHAESGRPVRRARLRLTHVDPWSVAKVSFLLSIAFAVVLFVAVFITWSVLGAAGVWGAINSVIDSFASSNDGTSTFDVRDYVGMGRVLGLTVVLSIVNVVLLTAVATLGAYLYNMASALLGGVEVTLSEDHD